MSNEKEKTKNDNIITTTEDRVRLTLKKYGDIKNGSAKLWTFLGLLISFVTTLLTAEFKNFLGLTADVFKTLFIFTSILFFILFLIEAIKLIKSKINGCGDEDWFVLHIQNKEKQKKERKTFDFSFMSFLGKFLQILLYISPILLWVLVVSLFGWRNAFGVTINSVGETSYTWLLTLMFSFIWYGITYFVLICYKDCINQWFDDTFLI